jgi:hypothetical protein
MPANFRVQFATGANFGTLAVNPSDTFEGIDPVENATLSEGRTVCVMAASAMCPCVVAYSFRNT